VHQFPQRLLTTGHRGEHHLAYRVIGCGQRCLGDLEQDVFLAAHPFEGVDQLRGDLLLCPGGDPVHGGDQQVELTRGLDAEGVARIVIMTKDRKQYRGAPLAPGVEIRPASRMVETAAELAKVPGATVLVYDESCANERRRLQKRGKLARPTEYVVINEEVCENCGDCGAASNCMSLQKAPTEFGDKTRIHTYSCNQDYSCVKGDCPSFTTVYTEPGKGYRARTAAPLT